MDAHIVKDPQPVLSAKQADILSMDSATLTAQMERSLQPVT